MALFRIKTCGQIDTVGVVVLAGTQHIGGKKDFSDPLEESMVEDGL